MRCKSRSIHWVFLIIIGLSSIQTTWPQFPHIRPNGYGLQVVTTIKNYKQSIKIDTSKRMVPLECCIKPLITDFKYATKANFTNRILYRKPAAYLRLPAARTLQNVQKELIAQGLTLVILDAYRPYSVTKIMWQVVPDERYAANPANGSGHNRGASVDVTIANLTTGIELEMPTAYDDFSEKAHHNYQELNETVKKNRQLLRNVMEKHGFVALETEWWHYSLPRAAQRFDLMDLSFKQMKRATRKNCY